MARFRYTDKTGTVCAVDTVEPIAGAIADGSLDPGAPVEDLETGQTLQASELAALADPGAVHGPGPDDEALAAFIGPFWTSYYKDALRKRPFNVAALAPFWLAWRGFVGTQVLAMLAFPFLWVVVVALLDDWGVGDTAGLWLSLAIPYLALGLVEGAAANPLLNHKARGAWTRIRRKNLDRPATLKAMNKAGGVSVANVIVLPLLAMLVTWQVYTKTFRHDHGKAYVAMMKSDLRNLVTAEEAYFADHVSYTTSLDSNDFRPSASVTIRIGAASATGWNATATHNAVDNQMCAVFVGSAASPVAGGIEFEPKCAPHRH